MAKMWSWLVQYGSGIILALLLGAILGGIPLFKETSLGDTKLTASRIVQFMGYGSALLLLWLLGQRVAMELPEEGKGTSFLRQVIIPLVTLVVVSAGYKVLWLLVGPFLGQTGKTIYNWTFVVGIVGAAMWLAVAWFRHSPLLFESLQELERAGKRGARQPSLACPECGVPVAAGVEYCGKCGKRIFIA